MAFTESVDDGREDEWWLPAPEEGAFAAVAVRVRFAFDPCLLVGPLDSHRAAAGAALPLSFPLALGQRFHRFDQRQARAEQCDQLVGEQCEVERGFASRARGARMAATGRLGAIDASAWIPAASSSALSSS